jgi:CheY-like chemotaxis protein
MTLVMVVDDDDSFRALAVRVIAAWGCGTVEADSVSGALVCASELRPDAVLADVGLPDGDGFDLAQKLRDAVGSIPIVLVSSDSEGRTAEVARRSGARGFLPKDELPGPSLRRLLDV